MRWSELFGEERHAYHAFADATAVFEDLVDAAITAYDYEANTLKEGPLAGIARTSDAYKLKVKGLRVELAHGEYFQYAGLRMAESTTGRPASSTRRPGFAWAR